MYLYVFVIYEGYERKMYNAVPWLRDFFWGVTRRIKNMVGLVYSIMFKFLGYVKEYIKYKVRGFP